ncbi:MAG TPA: AMP-binding protein [Burkholderiales bacterium]|jgi:acyl-coenzyme A synthetase/AMP-(fatty) acid ligase|nr:AMP-binding protein [Burkholderiales bacterium]
MAAIPLISHRQANDVIARRGSHAATVADFLGDIECVAEQLPSRRFLVNYCADRYRFAVGLAAALARGQVSLLPPNQAPEMLRQLECDYPELYVLTDAPRQDHRIEQVAYPKSDTARKGSSTVPAFPPDQVAAIAFTSGSTGRPTPHRKTWGALACGAVCEARRFGLDGDRAVTLVGTVPPQHMYGLESTVLLALHNGLALHAARPFYPADVRAALADIPGNRVLVTTPVHLRTLLAGDIELPPLKLIICATAPLSPELAAQAEARYAAPLHEIYGFTEAGMVASRRTVQGPEWHSLPDLQLRRQGDQVLVKGGHIEAEVPFTDVIELRGQGTFVLHGRSADLVNVAGKRSSLAYLNHQLNGIEGVQDGVFFMPDEGSEGVTRLAAFVVAPALSREALLQALRQRIDPVFLPRPLVFVDALPRDATGKLPRKALTRLVRTSTSAAGRRAAIVHRRFPADHPAAQGHFPGNPIIPGAVLLDEVIAAAAGQFQLPDSGCTVNSAKFLRPVRPGEEVLIRFELQGPGAIRFECRVGDDVVLSGTLRSGASQREDAA